MAAVDVTGSMPVPVLLAMVLLPIGATAQSYSIPGGNTVVFTGDWPAEQVQPVLAPASYRDAGIAE
jgi:hypothetical protein